MSRIATPRERYRAEVSGDIENVNGVLKITRILVRYKLRLPADKREAARAAFETYLPRCPAAQSVIAAIKIDHELEMADLQTS